MTTRTASSSRRWETAIPSGRSSSRSRRSCGRWSRAGLRPFCPATWLGTRSPSAGCRRRPFARRPIGGSMSARTAISVGLEEIDLPDFGLPARQPAISAETYRARIAALGDRAEAENLDVLVVYGDREHFANLAYLTGYDPRFEESLFLLDVRSRK